MPVAFSNSLTGYDFVRNLVREERDGRNETINSLLGLLMAAPITECYVVCFASNVIASSTKKEKTVQVLKDGL